MCNHHAILFFFYQGNNQMFIFFSSSDCKMPAVIERAVRKQNVHFLHNRIQYSVEFFQFMRKLATANAGLENSVREDFRCFSCCFLEGQANS